MSHKKKCNEEKEYSEDPFLLDDPGGSPLEWLEFRRSNRLEAVRREQAPDPWHRSSFASENDACTERRRRKLQHISINLENDNAEDRSDNVA